VSAGEGQRIYGGKVIMKNDNTQANHRGSSPPFQEPDLDFLRWLNGLKSIGQHDEMASRIQNIMRTGNRETKSTDLGDGARWQDEGGESGEGV
jgi:hypothetical protein